MKTNIFELYKAPLLAFRWVGLRDCITNKLRWDCFYSRGANFGDITIGPIEICFRLPWLKYNIWIRGYEEGYREGIDAAHRAIKEIEENKKYEN